MSGDWLDGYGIEPGHPVAPPRAVAGAWRKGMKRVLVEAISCEECGHLKLRRREEYGSIAYWQCERCAHRQKDDLDAGSDRVHIR